MLKELQVRIQQMRHVVAAMQEIPQFCSAELSVQEGLARIGTVLELRDVEYRPLQAKVEDALGALEQATRIASQTALDVLANMKSRFRSAEGPIRAAIEELSVFDPLPEALYQHLLRMSALWSKLPVPAESPMGSMGYVAWKGMNRASFDQIRLDLGKTIQTHEQSTQELQGAAQHLDQAVLAMSVFIQQVCTLGRCLLAEGSPQRALLESACMAEPTRPFASLETGIERGSCPHGPTTEEQEFEYPALLASA